MSSFREHCAFGFWKGALIVDGNGRNAEAMGQFGRLTKVADLPSKKVLTGYIRKAMALNDEGGRRGAARTRREGPAGQAIT